MTGPEQRSRPTPARGVVWYWLPVVSLCLAIFVQSAYPSPRSLPVWPHGDKLLHAAAYGLLAALFARALNSHARWHARGCWLRLFAVTAAILYGLSDEWHQSFVPARSFDLYDLLADGIGAVAGVELYLYSAFRLPKNRARH